MIFRRFLLIGFLACGPLAMAEVEKTSRPEKLPEESAAASPSLSEAQKTPEPTRETAGGPEANATSAEGGILAPNPIFEHKQVAHGATPAEIASLLRLGHAKFEKGDFASAEISFMQVLAEQATTEQDRDALLGLARTYRRKADFTKAAAVYERFIKDAANDPLLPSVYLELGRTLRALGAYKRAIARFYSVLNTTLKLPDEGQEKYRQLARTAQYEIAETYFQIGDYVQANRYFSKLSLLDLAPEDRARAHFKSVYALALAGEDEKAVAGLTLFLTQNPDDENVPEARYLLSVSLRKLGRNQESLRATLDLLRVENGRTQKDAARWAYWQRKTGNQLANDFYQSGDFPDAMAIYEDLAQISSDPAWSLPATYQLGLCYERLRNFEKARTCYQRIVEGAKTANEKAARSDLADLAEMAAWRLSQLSWQLQTESEFSNLFPPTSGQHQPDKNMPATPAAKAGDDHDTNRNTAVASRTL